MLKEQYVAFVINLLGGLSTVATLFANKGYPITKQAVNQWAMKNYIPNDRLPVFITICEEHTPKVKFDVELYNRRA